MCGKRGRIFFGRTEFTADFRGSMWKNAADGFFSVQIYRSPLEAKITNGLPAGSHTSTKAA